MLIEIIATYVPLTVAFTLYEPITYIKIYVHELGPSRKRESKRLNELLTCELMEE